MNNNSNRDATRDSTRESTREKTRQTRSETKTATRRSGRASESVPPPRTKRVPLTSRKSDVGKSQNTSSRNNNSSSGHVLYFDLVIIPRLDGAGDAQDFFENIRSNYYVLNSDADSSNTDILDHAIDGINAWNNLSKQSSSEKCQPTIIPTSTGT